VHVGWKDQKLWKKIFKIPKKFKKNPSKKIHPKKIKKCFQIWDVLTVIQPTQLREPLWVIQFSPISMVIKSYTKRLLVPHSSTLKKECLDDWGFDHVLKSFSGEYILLPFKNVSGLATSWHAKSSSTFWVLQCFCRYKTTTKCKEIRKMSTLAGFWGTRVRFYSISASAWPRTDMKKTDPRPKCLPQLTN
jgi:hypothetical protein